MRPFLILDLDILDNLHVKSGNRNKKYTSYCGAELKSSLVELVLGPILTNKVF